MKTPKSYKDVLIQKALEKLGMSELLNLKDSKTSNSIPVRAKRALSFPKADLYVEKGALFFITQAQYLFEALDIELAFIDEEKTESEGPLIYKTITCRVDSDTFETYLGNYALSEYIERVDDSLAETMKAIYLVASEINERTTTYETKYSKAQTNLVFTGLIFILLGFYSIFLGIFSYIAIFIGMATCFALSLLFFTIYTYRTPREKYSSTKDSESLRSTMSGLCKGLEEELPAVG